MMLFSNLLFQIQLQPDLRLNIIWHTMNEIHQSWLSKSWHFLKDISLNQTPKTKMKHGIYHSNTFKLWLQFIWMQFISFEFDEDTTSFFHFDFEVDHRWNFSFISFDIVVHHRWNVIHSIWYRGRTSMKRNSFLLFQIDAEDWDN